MNPEFSQKQKYLIYKLTNQTNGKFYIGITSRTLKQRFNRHKYAKKRSGRVSMITQAIKKYGCHAFTIEAIDKAKGIDEANEKEMHYIETLNPHYNLTLGGDGMKGFDGPKTAKHRKAISTGVKAAWKSPETRLLITLARSTGQKQKGPIKHKERFRAGANAYWTYQKIKNRTRINKELNSHIYKIKDAQGDIFVVTDIDAFCRKKKLYKGTLLKTAPGMQNEGRPYKGFLLFQAPIRRFVSIGKVARHLKIGRAAAAKMRTNNPKMYLETVDWMKNLGLIDKETLALP